MQKTLIIGPAWIGDMVMAQSLFQLLKQTETEITVLAPGWSLPLLARMPQVTAAVEMPTVHGELGIRKRWRLARKLKSQKFTRAIVLPGSFKSALLPWFAKIPRRTGYVGEQRYGLLNDIRKLERAALPLNVQRFAALGLPADAPPPTEDEIPRPALTVDATRARSTAARFGLDASPRIAALCPGAEYGPAKRWPPEHFAEVARELLARDWQMWLFGSAKDRDATAQVARLCGEAAGRRCVDLAGRTTLDEAVDLLSLARVAITNDSGLMHIAAAVGCNIIAIYGSSSAAFTPPLPRPEARADCLSLRLQCSPCFARECRFGHTDCLKKLSPTRVLGVVDGG